jgi:hypothetical protein
MSCPYLYRVRKAVAILLCLCLLTQCLAHLGVIGYYQFNKTVIAKTLCENKARPMMKCGGKCYLRKQLNKLDDTETSSKKAPVKTEKNEVLTTFILPETLSFPPYLPVKTAAPQHPFVLLLHDSLFPTSVFHPPSLNC